MSSPSTPSPLFSPIDEILAELRAGRMVVLTDDENRENEGDLVLPAQFVTPEAITFMLSKALGYLCLSLPERDCDRLDLHPQASVNTTVRGTAFTVSIDLHPKFGGTTGVSAKERARCIQLAVDPSTTAADFVRPGHVNPLRSRDGGVLVRTGQTEGSVDLCRLAGLSPAAIIIEIMKPDGEMARVPDLQRFCAEHKLKMCSVAQIIEHRLARESLVRRLDPIEGRKIRTAEGEFDLFAYESLVDPLPHVVLTVGMPNTHDASNDRARTPRPEVDEPVLVRMHRRHLLGDVFGDLSSGPDGATGDTLRASMRAIQAAGRGALVYLRTQSVHTPSTATLAGSSANSPGTTKIEMEDLLQSLRRPGSGAPDADSPDLRGSAGQNAMPMALREFGIGGQILRDLGIRKMKLLTNKSKAMPGLDAFGLEIVERVRIDVRR
jgi:3,4-dihydroxy 2-butanone 4-phosphate synthase / GTP cyclohydrolase II